MLGCAQHNRQEYEVGDLTGQHTQDNNSSSAVEASPQASNRAPNILIVDDNPNNLHLLCNILEGQGFVVRPANNGALALRTIENLKPDLVLLDINMPEMDGYEVCREIKKKPDFDSIPIIFISALSDIEDKVKAFEVGGHDYVTKPFQVSEILARVRTHLSLYQTQEQLSSVNEALVDARDRLEEKVEQRTLALTESNRKLHAALDQRDEAVRKTERQKDFYHALSEINRSVLMLDNPHALYEEATRIAVMHAGFTHAWISSQEENPENSLLADYSIIDTELCLPVACVGCRNSNSANLQDSLVNQGYRVIPRFETCDDCPKRQNCQDHSISVACFPLFSNDELIATFNMCTNDVDLIDEETLSLLKQMSGNISFGLSNYKREEEQEGFNLALKSVVSSVLGHMGESYLAKLVEQLAQALEIDQCAICIVREEADGEADLLVSYGDECQKAPPQFNLKTSVINKVLQGEPIHIERGDGNELDTDERFLNTSVGALYAAPIIGQEGKVVGVLEVTCSDSITTTNTLTGLLNLFALRIGTELQRIDLENRLRNHADDLESLVADRTEELKVLNKELESFSYTVSHDLRAPLRAIDGFSSALAEDYADKLDDQAQEYLNYLQESSAQMAAMIDGLLELSRSSRGDLDINDVDLSYIAEDALNKLRLEHPDRKVEANVQPGIVVKGDARLLTAVVVNLIGNAWKYTEGRELATIQFGMKEITKPHVGTVLCYYVTDNGAGFNMEFADNLFKPFQRLHRQSEFAGSGIGLATVQRIIARHGGEIWGEAKEHEGATFYFTIPAKGGL